MNYSGYESGKCVLVTGAAGFIGGNLVRRLALDDWFVIGLDVIGDAGDTRLKYARLAEWGIPKEEIRYNKLVVNRHIEKSSFIQLDLEDTANVEALFETYDIRAVCHLGGLADAVQSMAEPSRFVGVNVLGFVNVLENARKQDVEHVVYVGSLDDPDRSMPYAVSRSNELLAEVFSRTYSLPTTGLRVGKVYGPWGLPVETGRNFVYIDDVLDGLERLLKRGPSCLLKENKGASLPSYRVYDLGSGETAGTDCDNSGMERDYGYVPKTLLKQGMAAYDDWYREWYSGEHPRIEVERIVVGMYPFPCTMSWKYLWNKHLEPNFALSDNPDRLLKSLLVSDGFDSGLGLVEPEDWLVYSDWMQRTLKLQGTMKVFEVGCGAGAFLYPLYRKGFVVGGIDYASPLVHLAKLAMPGCRFEVANANGVDVAERADVVLANSVFQYFESLKVAEAVLLRMFQKSDGVVAVLNVPDLVTQADEVEASRRALPVGVYDELYKDIRHLYFERSWFVRMGKEQGWQVRVFSQQIPNYGKNAFRFNVLFKKEITC